MNTLTFIGAAAAVGVSIWRYYHNGGERDGWYMFAGGVFTIIAAQSLGHIVMGNW